MSSYDHPFSRYSAETGTPPKRSTRVAVKKNVFHFQAICVEDRSLIGKNELLGTNQGNIFLTCSFHFLNKVYVMSHPLKAWKNKICSLERRYLAKLLDEYTWVSTFLLAIFFKRILCWCDYVRHSKRTYSSISSTTMAAAQTLLSLDDQDSSITSDLFCSDVSTIQLRIFYYVGLIRTFLDWSAHS